MKMQVIGFEGSSGNSGKTGKAYEIGQLHAIVRLAAPYGEGSISKGAMGSTYRCSLALIQKIQLVTVPFIADVEVTDIMKYGKREQEVIDIVVEAVRKAA